jgi:hypothetical protein
MGPGVRLTTATDINFSFPDQLEQIKNKLASQRYIPVIRGLPAPRRDP